MKRDQNAIAATYADGKQPARSRRRPIAPRTKSQMVKVLAKRNRLVDAHWNDSALIAIMRDSKPTTSYARQIRAAYRAMRPVWVEVDEDYYTTRAEVLPPIDQRELGYVMGEPYSHDGRGRTLYLCFLATWADNLSRKRYWAKVATIQEWRMTYHSASVERMSTPHPECSECNGTGADGSRSNPEPCPVCNGKRWLPARRPATGSSSASPF